MKEAAIQRKHNLYRDSIVLGNSDPNLHLLGGNPSIDWTSEYGGEPQKTKEEEEKEEGESQKKRRMKQVVSMIQVEGSDLPSTESCGDAPSVRDIPEEDGAVETSSSSVSDKNQIQAEEQGQVSEPPETTAGVVEENREDQQTSSNLEVEDTLATTATAELSSAPPPEATPALPPPPHDDSGFQSPTSEQREEEEEASNSRAAPPQPVGELLEDGATVAPQSGGGTLGEPLCSPDPS